VRYVRILGNACKPKQEGTIANIVLESPARSGYLPFSALTVTETG